MTHGSRLLRNEIVLKLLGSGLHQLAIGNIVGLSQQMVSTISSWGTNKEVLSVKSVGRKARLSLEALLKLPNLLKEGAGSYGFTGDYWTHKRVKYVIETELGVVYEEKQVGRILTKIGWSRQKPQKKEAKQDLSKVAIWKETSLLDLKKKP